MLAESVNQVEIATGDYRCKRQCHRHQPAAQSIHTNPIADRNLRRRLCRPDGERSDPIAIGLRNPRKLPGPSKPPFQISRRLSNRCRRPRGAASSQTSAVSAAQALAQQLNATTQGIQTLRSNAEQDIGISVGQANAAMTQIAKINTQLQGMNPTDPAAATLMDQRDQAINQLSQLMDIRVSSNGNNQTSVYTSNGVELVGAQASQLTFNSQGTLNANSQWNSNPATVLRRHDHVTLGERRHDRYDRDQLDQLRPDRRRSYACATRRWFRRRPRSISWRHRYRVRCRTRPPPAPRSPARPRASASMCRTYCRATRST